MSQVPVEQKTYQMGAAVVIGLVAPLAALGLLVIILVAGGNA
jgi:hypothetical protein